ncbi:MAG: hypothetical protein RMJ98_09710 [Myxococcales bacterium]|nr:hypothetical protein [Myxococcales bacterium]
MSVAILGDLTSEEGALHGHTGQVHPELPSLVWATHQRVHQHVIP